MYQEIYIFVQAKDSHLDTEPQRLHAVQPASKSAGTFVAQHRFVEIDAYTSQRDERSVGVQLHSLDI